MQEYTEAGERILEKPSYDELTWKNVKTVPKRMGATHWTQKLAKALERYLKGLCDLSEEELASGSPELEPQAALGERLAADVWHVILDCDDLGDCPLQDEAKQKRKCEKQKRDKDKEKGKGSPSKKRHLDSSDSDGSSGSSSSGSSSSSSDASARRDSSKQQVSLSAWSPAKLPMIIVTGKNTSAAKPPTTS